MLLPVSINVKKTFFTFFLIFYHIFYVINDNIFLFFQIFIDRKRCTNTHWKTDGEADTD